MGDCCNGGACCEPVSSDKNEKEGFASNVVKIDSNVTFREKFDHILVRLGVKRLTFRIEPGLYALGDPSPNDPVLVSANYKLTFNILRTTLINKNLWILILDTHGINVWCAAGKGTFGTEELINKIEETELLNKVKHRKLILPQLGAPGVEAHKVQEKTGFRILYGPVLARDITEYLNTGFKATKGMRKKEFPFKERTELTPLELVQSWKVILGMAGVSALLTVIFGGFNSLSISMDLLPSLLAVTAGAVLTPMLLPWIPARAFAVKGALIGVITAVVFLLLVPSSTGKMLFIITGITAVSSFLAMNFTGASTYTSLSGVKKEMRYAVPFQIFLVVFGIGGRILFEIIGRNV
jgi:CO dehydrogenase/acetyl-CoA synthase delta subunit